MNDSKTPPIPTAGHHPSKALPPHICLFGGSLDVSNMGCRALTSSVVNLLKKARPDIHITLMHGSRTGGTRSVRSISGSTEVEVVNYRLSPRARLREHLFLIIFLALMVRYLPIQRLRLWICRFIPWLECLEKADIVTDICAGDSFSDIYGLKRYFFNLSPAFTAILMQKPLVLLPQTFGPFKSRLARMMARFVFEHSCRIYCRDRLSLEEVKKILGEKADSLSLRLCPDVAFSLDPLPHEQIQVIPPLPENNCRVIGINVSGLLVMGGYTRDNMFGIKGSYPQIITQLIRTIFARTDAHILLVPHGSIGSEESDIGPCRSFFDLLSDESQGRLHLVTGNFDHHEIKSMIGQCSFFIGSRLHACIAALSQGIPTIGIAYSRKFKGVFETVGLENLAIDATQIDQHEVVDFCMNLLDREPQFREHLREVLPGVKQDLIQIFTSEIFGASLSTNGGHESVEDLPAISPKRSLAQ